jgi:hypothetical protein
VALLSAMIIISTVTTGYFTDVLRGIEVARISHTCDRKACTDNSSSCCQRLEPRARQ